MQQYGLENIRNVVLLSHSGAGKTSASEAMLFAAGAIKRLGKVEDGSTTSDYDPDELKRQISISLSLLPCEWKGAKLNLVDTPGYSDFVGEVRAAMRVSEGAVIMVCAASGVEVGTEQVWEYCEQSGLPRLIFINKMDRENADFNKTVGQIQERFGAKCLPLQLPIGSQNSFTGIVRLLTMKAYSGTDAKEGEVPEALQSQANSFREKLIEAIAEVDDKLIEKYLEGQELSQEEIGEGLRRAIVAGKVVPILTGSALKSIGIGMLMDAINGYLPSAKEGKVVTLSGSKEETSEPSASAPLAALVFKTSADPYVGKLTYFRVYNGAITSNSQIWNANRNGAERIGQLFMIRGKNQEPVAQVGAGDMGAVAKLTTTNTGDTLCTQAKPLKIAPIEFPEPVFSLAVHPKTKADLDKLGAALSRIAEEDLTIEVHREAGTNETVMSGIGESQLEVAADRMQRKFGVGVKLEVPKVPYKETIMTGAKAEYKHKKQTGGHGQYGHVLLELEPLPRGSGFEFANKTVGGSIPRNYIPAVEKGVNEAIHEGVLGRYPVVDIKATVYDGSFHPVDSSEICFKIAGAGALRKGLAEGQPILLEPIMNIEVSIPEDYTGDIIGDLNTKRARVQGMNPGGGVNVIEAQVPQAEVLRYSIDLKSITQGRGSYKASFSHYEEVPAHIAEKIIAARQAEKGSLSG
ncbi:MAG TPA: elongation factor G [Dehalococcoidales bacterium]|nr:elongation factor G [Dehalococcoidales bacterium]